MGVDPGAAPAPRAGAPGRLHVAWLQSPPPTSPESAPREAVASWENPSNPEPAWAHRSCPSVQTADVMVTRSLCTGGRETHFWGLGQLPSSLPICRWMVRLPPLFVSLVLHRLSLGMHVLGGSDRGRCVWRVGGQAVTAGIAGGITLGDVPSSHLESPTPTGFLAKPTPCGCQ